MNNDTRLVYIIEKGDTKNIAKDLYKNHTDKLITKEILNDNTMAVFGELDTIMELYKDNHEFSEILRKFESDEHICPHCGTHTDKFVITYRGSKCVSSMTNCMICEWMNDDYFYEVKNSDVEDKKANAVNFMLDMLGPANKYAETIFFGYLTDGDIATITHNVQEDADIAKLGYTCAGPLIEYKGYENEDERLWVWTKLEGNKMYIVATYDNGNGYCTPAKYNLDIPELYA